MEYYVNLSDKSIKDMGDLVGVPMGKLKEQIAVQSETIAQQAATIEEQGVTIENQEQTIQDLEQEIADFPDIEPLSVTQNGTYSESGKAYSPVTVNVPGIDASYAPFSIAFSNLRLRNNHSESINIYAGCGTGNTFNDVTGMNGINVKKTTMTPNSSLLISSYGSFNMTGLLKVGNSARTTWDDVYFNEYIYAFIIDGDRPVTLTLAPIHYSIDITYYSNYHYSLVRIVIPKQYALSRIGGSNQVAQMSDNVEIDIN